MLSENCIHAAVLKNMGRRAPQAWKEMIANVEDEEEAAMMWCIFNRRAQMELGLRYLETQYLLPFYKTLVVSCFESFIELM